MAFIVNRKGVLKKEEFDMDTVGPCGEEQQPDLLISAYNHALTGSYKEKTNIVSPTTEEQERGHCFQIVITGGGKKWNFETQVTSPGTSYPEVCPIVGFILKLC